MEETTEPELIREDGWIIDPATGEVVGAYGWLDKDDVENEQELWLVQQQILKIESLMIGEQAQMRRIVEMCEKRIKVLQRKRDWIEQKYGKSAFNVARQNLPKGRKTYTSPYGEITFRTTKDRLVVDDHAQAVAWARMVAPDAVRKVETVLVSKIPAKVMNSILTLEQFVPHGMHIEAGAETARFAKLKGDEDGEPDQV
jgi:hypothetical protein